MGKVYKVIIAILSIIFVGSIVCIALIFFSYSSASKDYEEISSGYFNESKIQESLIYPHKLVDWEGLKEQNSDTIAWLYIPDTSINYPVVQTTDNSHYIKTNFNGETNWIVSPGALFLNCDANSDFSSQNNVIFGHNMQDGSMFHELESYTDESFAKSHSSFYLLTPNASYILTPVALDYISYTDVDLVSDTIGSSSDFKSFLNDRISSSLIDFSFDENTINNAERVVCLCTCDNSNDTKRYLLVCTVKQLG